MPAASPDAAFLGRDETPRQTSKEHFTFDDMSVKRAKKKENLCLQYWPHKERIKDAVFDANGAAKT